MKSLEKKLKNIIIMIKRRANWKGGVQYAGNKIKEINQIRIY